jgi:hypothetical protein
MTTLKFCLEILQIKNPKVKTFLNEQLMENFIFYDKLGTTRTQYFVQLIKEKQISFDEAQSLIILIAKIKKYF